MNHKSCKNESCENQIKPKKSYCSKVCFHQSKYRNHRNRWERGEEIIERIPQNLDLYLIGVISGFTAGEGSFFLNIGKSKTHCTGFQLTPIFTIRLKKTDSFILEKIREVLKCGSISFHENTVSFTVRKLEDHLEVIIPFFDKFPLLNIKNIDFQYYKMICYKLAKGEGKELDGIKRILSIRDVLNNGGTQIRKKISI
jgi:hypothetical protein